MVLNNKNNFFTTVSLMVWIKQNIPAATRGYPTRLNYKIDEKAGWMVSVLLNVETVDSYIKCKRVSMPKFKGLLNEPIYSTHLFH